MSWGESQSIPFTIQGTRSPVSFPVDAQTISCSDSIPLNESSSEPKSFHMYFLFFFSESENQFSKYGSILSWQVHNAQCTTMALQLSHKHFRRLASQITRLNPYLVRYQFNSLHVSRTLLRSALRQVVPLWLCNIHTNETQGGMYSGLYLTMTPEDTRHRLRRSLDNVSAIIDD